MRADSSVPCEVVRPLGVSRERLPRLRPSPSSISWFVVGLALLPARAFADTPPQPSGLAVLHRDGQSFLTWQERGDRTGESYRVYRHTSAITAGTIGQAALLYTVPAGSSRFFANRYQTGSGWDWRYTEGLVIEDGGAELTTGTGLLVWTLAGLDFGGGASGLAYYAVTTVDAEGHENLVDFGAANTEGPVAEAVAAPSPVEITHLAPPPGPDGAGRRIFIQYLDLRHWNATFHAPRSGNGYYGLDSGDPAVAQAIQYAYDYAVFEPTPGLCGGSLPAAAPAFLYLHGWSGGYYDPVIDNPNPYWCAYSIYPIDMSETWFFGFARDHDYRIAAQPPDGSWIANFTERRILRMVADLLRQPTASAQVDSERFYLFGHSMGGSGSLAFALRYPEVFAAAYASEPMTDYRTASQGSSIDWLADFAPKWGTVAQNLPIELDAPNGWADHLRLYRGVGVYDWQSHRENLRQRQADPMVPFGVAHGTQDDVIAWASQGQPFYDGLDASRQSYAAEAVVAGHFWQGFNPLPVPLRPDQSLSPFDAFQVLKSETVPGLANASGNGPIPPPGAAAYNTAFDWSTSWDPWDGSPIDEPGRWRITLRVDEGGTQSVDVTPRRTQSFAPPVGRIVNWENRALAGGALVASGSAVVDACGLVTVAQVTVTAGGNRLEILTTGASSIPAPCTNNLLPILFADGFESGDTSAWSS